MFVHDFLAAWLAAGRASADPQRQEKRRRFKEARKAHYHMGEMILRWVLVGAGGWGAAAAFAAAWLVPPPLLC